MKLARQFSVKAGDGFVSVFARAAAPSLPVLKPRAEVIQKLDASLLHESLNAHDRRLVFRPSKAYHLEQGEPIVRKGRTLKPMTYPGLPAVGDLLSLVETSACLADLAETWEFFKEYYEHDNSRANLRPEQFSALLRKSAELGDLRTTIANVFGHRTQFSKYTTPAVFNDALRLYALQLPSLSRRSKNTLYKIYYRAAGEPGRDLALLYGIVKYSEKFGTDDAKKLKEVVDSAVSCVSKAGVDKIDPIDVSLGLEGAKAAGPVGQPLVELLSTAPAVGETERELLKVMLKANEAESVEPEGQAPLVEDA